ncbi:nuclear transport factor 2 family protein [Sphingobium algorifonticola]|uniref:Nuclear transport factor 2 family protein n=1 Tax=Sphingobium algorifonticola TaxID=2008318 RepID=A0A437JBI6_9SPHN|nr:nuclear transport factor 2 family protein [Sphingobium algorifonticola]RVT43267.1 nuclear transport factor 2 family protein [Sphingobium algorifonticola]
MDSARYRQITEMVDALYAATAAGDWATVDALLTDDFRILEADNMPYPGEYKGKGALQELYTKVFAFWEDPSLERHDLAISETNAIVMLTMHATSRHNGERLAMPMCEVMHVRGDRFSGITPYYFDTAAIARATGTLRP